MLVTMSLGGVQPLTWSAAGTLLRPGTRRVQRSGLVAPLGEATVFRGPQRVRIRDICDGESNTVMLVEVDGEYAVKLTKPEDWT